MTIAVSPMNSVHYTAQQAIQAGISVVPIRTDGSKQPVVAWREYQQRCAALWEIERWFSGNEAGIAFVTGSVSGGLEALDFDDRETFEAWLRYLHNDAFLSALYEHLITGYFETTPSGGRHLLYRCQTCEKNQKLACRPDGDRRKTLIETRGEGGLIIVAPSCGRVHPTGKPYMLQSGGVSSIKTITADQRSLLIASARSFDEMPPVCAIQERKMLTVAENGLRPGDLFNKLASWEEVLMPHGWELVRMIDGEGYWRRPDKKSGISATTNHNGHDLLYVFSTSTLFEAERGYTKFTAYTLLNHGGDFKTAARALVELGYSNHQTTRHLVNSPDLRKSGTQERKHL